MVGDRNVALDNRIADGTIVNLLPALAV